MASGYGVAGHIGIGKESAWGTAVAATAYFEAMSESLTKTLDRYDTRNIIGGLYEPDDTTGLERVAGSISCAAWPFNLPYFLMGAMGVNSITVILSGFLWRNDFLMLTADNGANNALVPYTLEIFRDVTSSQQYAGVQFNRVRLAGGINAPLMIEADVIAKAMLNIAKTSPTFTASPVNPFAFDTCSLQLGGAASAIFESFALTIDNGVEGVATLNASTTISRVRRTAPQMLGFEGTVSFEDITELNRFVNQTETALKINMTKANSFALVIDAPKMVYTAFPTGMSGRGRQTVNVAGKLRYHSPSATALLVSVTNTSSGGY